MIKSFKNAMDPISSYTHFIGACFSVVGLLALICLGVIMETSTPLFVGMIVFGISLIALYSASSIYHYFHGNEKIKLILRKLDHSMIYVLIVGTYTPIVLSCMEVEKSFYFLGILWSIAIIGVLLKIVWMDAPRFISTIIYLILGWAIVFDFQDFQSIPFPVFVLIACGGISYSIGAIIYIIKKPNISEEFGFHEIFHLFVMLGSLFHYIAILMLAL